MEWLDYHHLLYFWTVARESSVSKAAEKLAVVAAHDKRRMSPRTIQSLFDPAPHNQGGRTPVGISQTPPTP